MTTRSELHSTINALIHKMRDLGTQQDGHRITWHHTMSGYYLVWEKIEGGGQSNIVFLGKGPTSARETAWDMIALLDTVKRHNTTE